MTVTKALSDIKVLEDRISKKTKEARFVSLRTVNNEKLRLAPILVEDFNNEAKANYQSINDLITERNKRKQSVILSNAVNKVKVGNKEYTVAEAIERKNSIVFEEQLLNSMKSSYSAALKYAEKMNNELEESINNFIEQYANNTNSGKKQDEAIKFGQIRRETESVELVDPLNIKTEIDRLELDITEFKAEVDQALSISNATTVIEI